MWKNFTRALVAAIAVFIAPAAFADGPGDAGPNQAAAPVRAGPVSQAQAPEGRTGIIPLSGGELALNVPAGYRLYSAEEAYAFLQRANAPAPSGAVLGLLAPASVNVRQPGAWATVVSYDAIGYVQPETASGLAAENFETDVRTARASQSRGFEGFSVTPTFETTTPKLTWAERTAAAGSGGRDLRFEQKVLGRNGVACLTSIGSADQLPDITAVADAMLAMLSFPEGRRHSDYQPANDPISAFTVPGLVTGLSSQQMALVARPQTQGQSSFGGFAGWFPWIALGVAGLAGAGYMLFRRRPGEDEEGDDDTGEPETASSEKA